MSLTPEEIMKLDAEGIGTPSSQANQGPTTSLIDRLGIRGSLPDENGARENRGIKGVLAGVAKGVASTVVGGAELGTKILRPIERGANALTESITGQEPAPSLLTSPDQFESYHQSLEGKTPSEKFGKGAEQIAEFFIPGGAVTNAEKAAAASTKSNLLSKLIPYIGENAAGKVAAAGEMGSKMAVRGAEGAGIVGVQSGGDSSETGTAGAVSAAFPIAGATLGAFSEAGKSAAPKIINSLIKPLLKDFSYGKNPGRAVAELGITASSLDDLASKIGDARRKIGERLGGIYKKASEMPENRIDLTPQLDEIDSAINEAAKGGRNNQGVVSRLQNIKEALLHEHSVDAEGNIIRISENPRDLSSMTPEEAFDFKRKIGDMTQFTGNASDDKVVNSLLKRLYGGTKEELNKAVSAVDSDVSKLNEQYADLTSAEVAAKYRDKISSRQNLISLPSNVVGLGSGILTAVATGGAAVPAVLAGAGGIMLERAVSTPRVKTEVAKWLASSTPQEKQALFKAVPALRGAIIKALTGND